MISIPALLLFAGAIGVLVWALGGSRQPAGPVAPDGETNLRAIELAPSFFDRVLLPTMTRFGRMLAKPMPPERLAVVRKKIVLSGKQQTWNTEKALAVKAFGLMVGVVGALGLLALQRSTLMFVAAGLVLLCGYFFMDYYLDKAAGARQLEIQQALPDVLDQISVCVEAGIGFDAALHRCSLSNDNALGDELGRTMQDIRLGMPRRQALYALLDRTDVQELRLFVRALAQAEKSGIPIAKVLSVQSDEVREKRRQAAEERAMKLPVKLILPLVLCILPSLFTVIMGPAVIRMMRNGAV
jgi:tight adherence protein C